ncbi:MAG: DNA mismatch repair endonuclease MutL [Dysosmobacter sp.]|nr:DNA mismatch repair endonuclease MutL [Dysosmobacter sp.]
MPHIQEMPREVSELIAAGEVVERPASVVKELVENALDAGASAVTVEIRGGGMKLIRVTDNGCGIAPAELPTAFLRHATSKLRTAEDLGHIGTLGFRGEALAAIAAVSRIEIVSRETGTDHGASLALSGGVPGETEPAPAPEGTTIYVRDLFYNTPARLKFMKKDSAETGAISALVQHLALSRPEVSFRLIRDGQTTLHTPGDGREESAVYAALGRDFATSLLPVSGRGGEVEVKGFVTKPLAGRGSRNMQFFFLNGRFIKSQLLTAAVEEGYRNQLLKGRFPGCVLHVTLPLPLVDVNVHPAKTQVKFAREKEVFDAVYHTVMDCLDADSPALAPKAPPAAEVTNPRNDFFQRMDAKTFREGAKPAGNGGVSRENPPAAPVSRPAIRQEAPKPSVRPAWNSEWAPAPKVADSAGRVPYATKAPTPRREAPQPAEPQEAPRQESLLPPEPPRKTYGPAIPAAAVQRDAPQHTLPPAIPSLKAEVPGQETLEPREAPWRIAGEILHTYIVCESEEGRVYLIDKHAAHERINFDRLKAAQEPPMRQTLLAPIPVELSREDAAAILENLPLLEGLGFACEDFGDGTVLLRELPSDIDAADAAATLEEFAAKLRSGRSLEQRRDDLLHTMACKAAIKGGWKSDPAELRALVDRVQSGEVKYCPHGRPVAVRITKYELEKLFKRA